MDINVQTWDSGFEKMADHLRAMIDEVQSGTFFKSHHPHIWKPSLNLYETRGAFVVCVDLAGVVRERIEITFDRDVLTIRGVRDKPVLPESEGDVRVHLMEIDSGRFERRVQLLADVDRNRITAAYRHGFLWIALPRTDKGEAPNDP